MKKAFALVAVATILTAQFTSGQSVEWERQGFAGNVDYSRGVSADGSGNVYISGVIFDDIIKSFVRKYDSAGNLLWNREIVDDAEWNLGLSEWTEGYGVSADRQGSVYSVGFTEGELEETHVGGRDAFIAKYNEDGTRQWTRRFGTTADDIAYSVSADSLGEVFMAGSFHGDSSNPSAALENAFLNKYDASGAFLWSTEFGVANMSEVAMGVSADGLGNVYLAGSKFRDDVVNAVPSDVFLSKYDTGGVLQWTQQFGEIDEDERATGVSADGLGNVYVSFAGALFDPNTQYPTFGALRKYDDAGALLWTYEPEPGQSIAGVSADALGNVYISSNPIDDLASWTFVSKLNGSGELLWTLTTFQDDEETINMARNFGISADGLGNVYSAGLVDILAPFGGVNFDAFLIKISVPEPTSFTLLMACSVLGLGLRGNR